MLKLPKIPCTMDKDKQQVVSMGSINYSKMTKDGDVADSSGISGRQLPYITTAKKCAPLEGLGENMVSATFFRGEWVTVDAEGKLYYGGNEVGLITAGEKQFAAINTKLVIMPDKKYLDVSGNEAKLKDLGATVESTEYTVTDNSISLTSGYMMTGDITVTPSQGGGTLIFNKQEADEERTGFYLLIEAYNSKKWRLTYVKPLVMDKVTFKTSNEFEAPINAGNGLPTGGFDVYMTWSGGDYVGEWNKVTSAEALAGSDPRYRFTLSHKSELAAVLDEEQAIDIYIRAGNIYEIDKCEEREIDTKLSRNGKDFFVDTCSSVSNSSFLVRRDSGDGPKLSEGVHYGFSISNGGWIGNFDDLIANKSNLLFAFEINGQKYEGVGKPSVSNSELHIAIESIAPKILYESVAINSAITLTPIGTEASSFDSIIMPGDIVTASSGGKEVTFRVDSVNAFGYTLVASSDVFRDMVFSGKIKIERRIPTLHYICEHANRLCGCSNDDQTIYVSALGDPTNIYAYEGVSTDSYAVAVASEGNFTGCCPYDGGVMFWKEQRLHKLLGSYPAEYALYTYNIDGVQEGSHKSLQNIGEVLFYKGERGVFAFDGSPRLISENFGEKRFDSAVAGSDGECYYVSMKDKEGKQHFFSYNTRTGLWVREGEMAVGEFIRTSEGMHVLEGGKIYLYGAEETAADSEWFIQLAPIYESIEGKKSYSRIKMRIELPRGSYMTVAVRCDCGRWTECGKIVGRVAGVVPVMIPINRCDRFELKISGKGPCTIHSILREYFVGGDR